MGILEQINLMKSQGMSDQEVISKLQEQGIPPKSIQDSMAQANIKNAVSGFSPEGMQQSILEPPNDDAVPMYEDEDSAPMPEQQMPENYAPQTYPQEQYAQEYSQPQEYYAQEEYAYAASDTSTLIEIAEQVFSDKVKKIQNQMDSLNEFKTLTETRITLTEDRLKRIESTIDRLQASILDKVGSYGNTLDSIKKEMSMMQDSFSKTINPLMDRSEHKFSRKK